METNFKGSRGNFKKIFAENNCRAIRNEGGIIIRFWKPNIYQGQEERHDRELEETQANQQLCLDAFNVRQQINVDLPELLEQMNELLEAVKEAKSVICSMKLSMWVHPDCSKDSEFYDMATTGEETEDKLEDLITKIEQK